MKSLICAARAGLLALCLCAASAHASVVIGGTRVVFPAADGEVTVRLTNQGNSPALVESWIDDGNVQSTPDKVDVPFLVTPPLFRLEPNKDQNLRIVATPAQLPADRESLFWLNVLEVPPRNADADRNLLQFAFRSRIKFIFRPAGLPGSARDAPAQVTWKFVHSDSGGYALQAANPTPYHVTFTKISAVAGASRWTNERGGMVVPGATAEFDIGAAAPSSDEPAEVD